MATGGTSGNDTLISTGTTSETLNGGAGNDYIDAGLGNDNVIGGSGADTMFGGDGNDLLVGGADEDLLNGGDGSDRVNGDAGKDTLVWSKAGNSAGFRDYYDGGSGYDTLKLVLNYDEYLLAQTDINNYYAFIKANTTSSGETNGAVFQFSTLDLDASKFEKLTFAPIITSGSSGSLAENNTVPVVVYKPTLLPGGDTKVTYSLQNYDKTLFEIDPVTGWVTFKGTANYESVKSYSFTVVVTDSQKVENEQNVTINVTNVNDAPTGTVTISGTAAEDQTLTASHNFMDEDGLGTVLYQWYRDGQAINGAMDSSYTLKQADVGKAITVKASYTDGQGTLESKTSGATSAVANVDDVATGTVTISGDAVEDGVLSASSEIVDEDGTASVTYEWFRNGQSVGTGETYTLGQADVGQAITVKATATDAFGNDEVFEAISDEVQNVDDVATGTVTISGDAVEDGVLSASSEIVDEDGTASVTYEWFRNGQSVGTGETYTLGQADVGQAITVKATATDAFGNDEVFEAISDEVQNVDDVATGTVSISGDAVEDGVLSASSEIVDEDGTASVTYEWFRNGQSVGTGETYTLGQADVGQAITVKATATDAFGNDEVFEAISDEVQNVDDVATGTVTISGDAVEDGVLSASSEIVDEDGTASVTYEWFRNGQSVGTGETYTLGQADVGQAITVKATATDAFGNDEVFEAISDEVQNVDDVATGTVTISGDAVEDGVLSASSEIVDEDGTASVTYEWFRNGQSVGTGETYTLGQADVGQAITVKATATDAFGNDEVFEATSALVANLNDGPQGTVSITDPVTNPEPAGVSQGETLTASDNIQDGDGIVGSVAYQWQRWVDANNNSVADSGETTNVATGSSYTTTQADVGAKIRVVASYTDGGGTNETVTSAPTTAVVGTSTDPTNVNPPAGTGTAADNGTNNSAPGIQNDGTGGADTLVGSSVGDTLLGNNNSDTLYGLDGNDLLQGQDANDTIYGGAGSDDLRGGGGNDVLYGGSGTDSLDGDAGATGGGNSASVAGNDALYGGWGADQLWGAAGADTFHFLSVEDSNLTTGMDIIKDLSLSQSDTVNLSTIDANTNTAANDAFTLVAGGTGAFTNVAGELRFDNATHQLQGDVNGDGTADLVIQIDNLTWNPSNTGWIVL